MRERIKSIMLIILVLSSLYLTNCLVFGQPNLEMADSPQYEQLTFGELKPLEEQVLPFLRLQREEAIWELAPWLPHYNQAWQRARQLLQPGLPPQKSDPPAFLTGLKVQIDFPTAVDPDLWSGSSLFREHFVQAIVWFASHEDVVWFLDENDQWWRAGGLILPDGWLSRLEVAFSTAQVFRFARPEGNDFLKIPAEGVLVPKEVPVMSRYTLAPEPLDYDKLLHSMFVNMATVRRIEERNGIHIYTDGQRGLQLFPHGELEYTIPENELGTRPLAITELLKNTAEYLHLLGGWPDQLYLKNIKSKRQVFENGRYFYTHEVALQSVQKGFPLVGIDAVLITCSEKGIVSYNRQVYQLEAPEGEAMPLISPEEAMAAAGDWWRLQAGNNLLLSLYPVYYVDNANQVQPVAQPAWLFRFENRQAVVDGYTGKFIKWLE